MSDRPKFSEGIYNYCDYICEKCAYTAECYLFWSERHPGEARKDLEKAFDRMRKEFGEDIFKIDEEWETSYEDEVIQEQEEERAEKIIAPSREIIDIAHPMLKELYPTFETTSNERVREAIDKIATNHMLISAKYYRAVHGLPENPSDPISEGDYWGLSDSEKTFLAMKGFIWNLKVGCRTLAKEIPKYEKRCSQIIKLANLIYDRIENDHLPLIQKLIQENRERFEGDSE